MLFTAETNETNGVTSAPRRNGKRSMVLELQLRCTATAAAAATVTAKPTTYTAANTGTGLATEPHTGHVSCASEDRWDELASSWTEREARFLSSHRAAKRAGSRRSWYDSRERVSVKLLRAKIPSTAVLSQVTQLAAQAAAKEAAAKEAADRAHAAGDGRPRTELQQAVDFETLRAAFISKHQAALTAELGPTVTFSSFPLAKHIERAFVSRCKAHRQSVPGCGFHGTKSHNYQSIANSGFLIPGKPNTLPLRSVNGMTHGTGVYMSNPGAAWLSRTFCDGPDLLVVATVDPHPEQDRAAAAKKPDRFIGPNIPRKIHRETPYLREVEDATIFFETDYIVPIAIAHGAGRLGARPAVSQFSLTPAPTMTQTASVVALSAQDYHSGRPGGFSPNKLGAMWVGRRQTFVAGEIAWLPAERVGCKSYMRVKRKLVSKTRALSRGRERAAKAEFAN